MPKRRRRVRDEKRLGGWPDTDQASLDRLIVLRLLTTHAIGMFHFEAGDCALPWPGDGANTPHLHAAAMA